MVKSLEMRKLFTSKWTTAVLSHHSTKSMGVKEQRVDGSSRSRNLDLVRCTLIAGKPVFGRTIYTGSRNKNFMHTLSNPHCNNSVKLNPLFVTGLTDAEGNFTLGFYKSSGYKMGYQIQAIFKITMHKKDYFLLLNIQNFFAVGKITKHGETTLQLSLIHI